MDDSTLVDLTVSSVGSSIFTSTPKKPKRKTPSCFKAPKPVTNKKQGPIVGVRVECGKEYRSKKYYVSHVANHKLNSK